MDVLTKEKKILILVRASQLTQPEKKKKFQACPKKIIIIIKKNSKLYFRKWNFLGVG